MKKLFSLYNLFLVVLLVLLVNCQRDDICDTLDVTPRIIIDFIDEDPNNTDLLVKNVQSLVVQLIVDEENLDSEENRFLTEITTNQTTEQRSAPTVSRIILPLNTLSDEVTFSFTRNFGNEDESLIETETLKFSYTRNENFINRACGFQTTFDALEIERTTPEIWISRIEILNTTITDEEDRHLLLFH